MVQSCSRNRLEETLRTLALAVLCATSCAAVAASSPAGAADPFYIGSWKFSGAVKAPWFAPDQASNDAEVKRLLGKTVTIRARAITGPQPFACKGPHYKLDDYPADFLFQGAFGEMQRSDPSVDPEKLAASLGFTGKTTKTLETGCEFDYHFVDESTAEIGLNNYVYTLKKQ